MGQNTSRLWNSEGDEVVFHKVRFPLAAKTTQKAVAARLDALSDLRKENKSFWNWLSDQVPGRAAKDKQPNALAWNVAMEDGTVVLGNIELSATPTVRAIFNSDRKCLL